MISLGGHPLGMFDYQPVIIQEINSAIWSYIEVDGPEPGVRRGQKLHVLMGAGRRVTYAGRLKNIAMRQVLRGLGSQREQTERRKCATEINRDRTCRGKRSDAAEHLHARVVRNGVDRRRPMI